jgi:hypothetical protein
VNDPQDHTRRSAPTTWLPAFAASAAGGLAAGLLVWQIIALGAMSDYPSHAKMASQAVDPGAVFGHFLYFVTVAAAAGWSASVDDILRATPWVLGVAIGFAVLAAVRLVGSLASNSTQPRGIAAESGIAVSTLALFFSFSFPVTHNYLGQFPPMVWHNSTTLFLMPFSIMLFAGTVRMLEGPTSRRVALVLALVLANVAAKPSFVLAWIPAVTLYPLATRMDRRRIVAALLTSICALAFVGAQSLYIFTSDTSARLYRAVNNIQLEGLRIAPLYVWHRYSGNVVLSMLASNVLTITAVLVWRRRLMGWRPFQFALLLYGVGLAIWILLALGGDAAYAADLLWQMVPCTMLLYLTIVAFMWRRLFDRGRVGPAEGAVLVAMALQIVAFVRYMDIYLSTGIYT